MQAPKPGLAPPSVQSNKFLETEQWVATTVALSPPPRPASLQNYSQKHKKNKGRRRKSEIATVYEPPTDFTSFNKTRKSSFNTLSPNQSRETLKLPTIDKSTTSLNLIKIKGTRGSSTNILEDENYDYSDDEHHYDYKAGMNDDSKIGNDNKVDESNETNPTNISKGDDFVRQQRNDMDNNVTENTNNNNDNNDQLHVTSNKVDTDVSFLTPNVIPAIKMDSMVEGYIHSDIMCNVSRHDVSEASVTQKGSHDIVGEADQKKKRRKRLVRGDAKDLDDENIVHIVTPKNTEEDMFRLASKRNSASNSSHPTVRFYNRVCKKLGVLPLRKVASQFGKSHLSFRNLTLTTKDMKAVCLALQKEQNAFSLDFTGNFMSVKEVDYLLIVLNHLHTVFQVSLCNNCLSGQAVKDVSRFLLMNDYIVRLDLSGNKLNDHDAPAVTDILMQNTTIKTLVLNHNEFREEGGTLLGQAIAENNTLEDIDLSWNHLRRCGAVGVAKGLQSNTALRTVNLAWNGFGFEGCVAIGDMLSCNCTITELNLAYNRINPPALLELLRGISSNKTLRILRIGYNPVTAAFSSLILAVVKKHRESGLENIDMAGVVVDKEFVALLEEIQKDRFFIVNYEVSLPVKKISREEMREKIGLPSAYNVDPLRMLYLLKEKMRASDFFYKINKDHDDGLQRGELYSLFDEAGIPVTGSVVDKIMEFMDTNGDGTIDLGEFLQGDKRIKNISRKQIRDEQERRTKDASYSKYSRTFQKTHIDPITNALKVNPSSTPMRQSRRTSVSKSIPESEAEDNHLKIP